MRAQAIFILFIGMLLFKAGYAKKCKKLNESCKKDEDCCPKKQEPPGMDNLCSDSNGEGKGSEKKCMTFKETMAKLKACVDAGECKKGEGSRSWYVKGGAGGK